MIISNEMENIIIETMAKNNNLTRINEDLRVRLEANDLEMEHLKTTIELQNNMQQSQTTMIQEQESQIERLGQLLKYHGFINPLGTRNSKGMNSDLLKLRSREPMKILLLRIGYLIASFMI